VISIKPETVNSVDAAALARRRPSTRPEKLNVGLVMNDVQGDVHLKPQNKQGPILPLSPDNTGWWWTDGINTHGNVGDHEDETEKGSLEREEAIGKRLSHFMSCFGLGIQCIDFPAFSETIPLVLVLRCPNIYPRSKMKTHETIAASLIRKRVGKGKR
jgi:hypothetical protein